MSNQHSLGGFSILPTVVKNLLIINGLFFLATMAFARFNINLTELLGLYIPQSELFKPHQLVTYIFMHSPVDWTHIGFNMFALWMFGSAIENYWGGKRFLIYYMVTGLGAGLIHLGVLEWQFFSLAKQLTTEQLDLVLSTSIDDFYTMGGLGNQVMNDLSQMMHIPTVGASGAVFGLLLAFGMMFPNSKIYLYFLFPIKAKYFVIGYGLMELYFGMSNRPGDNVAHFAHLGGMPFGYILIKYWQKNRFRIN